MARRRRYFVAEVPLHIIQRGNNKQACFYTEGDYAFYLDNLREYSHRYDVAIHSFVLMTNHVHLLMTPSTDTGASQLMQALGASFVQYINEVYRRSGTLWEGRFKASLVHSSRYLFTVSRYIELNPVRAGMVEHPAAYPWSSYRSNALGKKIRLLTPHPLYLALGETRVERCSQYRKLFSGRCMDMTDDQIREATNKGWVVGDNRFKAHIERQLGHAIPPMKRGGSRKMA